MYDHISYRKALLASREFLRVRPDWFPESAVARWTALMNLLTEAAMTVSALLNLITSIISLRKVLVSKTSPEPPEEEDE
jgi:hypothetical protein